MSIRLTLIILCGCLGVLLSVRLFVMGYLQDSAYIFDLSNSPDRKYLAVGFVDSGGGAGTGWCQTKVDLMDLSDIDPIAHILRPRQTIFYIDNCDDGYKVGWNDAAPGYLLEIQCPDNMLASAARVLMKGNSLGSINIDYEGCPEQVR